jgi:glycosyltransferase involved in cell wall biosynthesis
MKGFHVLGVTQISDSYPNVKYKLLALKRLLGEDYVEYVLPLGKTDTAQGFSSAINSSRPALVWRLLIGHIQVLLYSMRHRAKRVYVCYPGIFLAVWMGLPFMRRRYPVMYLDAFISLYDTIVFDRCLLRKDGLLAKILYRLEKKAFTAATVVIVDTPENAQYYSGLFDIPEETFYAMPLCIPPLLPNETKAEIKGLGRIRCIFVGTFVPLQGIRTIVEAAKILADDTEIDFVFVGDGQDANYLQDFMEKNPKSNVTWHRGHFPTQFVTSQIRDADICLGIFGEGPKAQRVLPYKIYYYLALGMPVVTANTATTKRVLTECHDLEAHAPMLLVPPGDAQSLANALRQLSNNPVEVASTGSAGADYYRRALSEAAIQQSLQHMIDLLDGRYAEIAVNGD